MNNIFINIQYLWKVIYSRIKRKKTLAFFILLFTITYIFISPNKELSRAMDYPFSENGFVFLLCNPVYAMLFFLSVIYYFSDVPFNQYSEMWRLHRMNKKRWVNHQIAYIFTSSVLITVLVFGCSLISVFPYIRFEGEWGKLIYTSALTNVEDSFDLYVSFPYDVIERFTSIQALIVSCIVCILVIFLFGLLMFALSLMISRSLATIICSSLTFMPLLAKNTGVHFLMYVSPISWISIDNVSLHNGLGSRSLLDYAQPSLLFILITLAILLIALVIIIKIKLFSSDFDWVRED